MAGSNAPEVEKDTLDLTYNFTKNQTGGLFLDYLAEKEIIFDNNYWLAWLSS